MPCCTEAKLDANRQNAQKSTGPKTPEGKARASQNALKHGLRARGASVLPTEDPAAYESYTASIHSLRPATPLEHELATRAADLLWRLKRVPDAEAHVLASDVERRTTAAQDRYHRALAEHEAYCRRRPTAKDLPDPPQPPDPARGTAAYALAATFCSAGADKNNPYLALQRYETTLDRALSRTLKELRQLQKDRRDHPAGAEADANVEVAPPPNEPTPPKPASEGAACADAPPAPAPNEPTLPLNGQLSRPSTPSPTSPAHVTRDQGPVTTQLPNEPTAPQESQIPRLFHLKRSDLPHPPAQAPDDGSITPPP